MTKWRCFCDETIRATGPIPHPYEWLALSDFEQEELAGTEGTRDLTLRGTLIWRCPKCDRLWAFWNGFDQAPTVYEPKYLEWSEDQRPNPGIERLSDIAKKSIAAGRSRVGTLRALRDAGANIVDSIQVSISVFELEFGEARRLVESSETWSDVVSETERERYAALEKLIDDVVTPEEMVDIFKRFGEQGVDWWIEPSDEEDKPT